MKNLGAAYRDLGRHAEALALLKDTLERRKAKLCPDHLDTLKSMQVAVSVETAPVTVGAVGQTSAIQFWAINTNAPSVLSVNGTPDALALLAQYQEIDCALRLVDFNTPNSLGQAHRTVTIPTAQLELEMSADARQVTIRYLGDPTGALPDDNYRLTIAQGAFTDLDNNPNAAAIINEFFVFAGDAGRDRTVGISDFAALAAHFNQPGVFSDGDFNYSGVVEIGDFSILASKFNTSLPAPARMMPGTGLPGSMVSPPPMRSRILGTNARGNQFSDRVIDWEDLLA